jgi:hypothetical protein
VPSAAQSFSGPTPTGLVTTFYCLRFETLPTWRARSPYLHPPGTGWPSYTSRHWVPFSLPPTTRRAAVEAFEPPPYGILPLNLFVSLNTETVEIIRYNGNTRRIEEGSVFWDITPRSLLKFNGLHNVVSHKWPWHSFGFPPRRPDFETRSGHVGFTVDKVPLRQVLSEYFGFSYQFSFHQMPIIHPSSGAGTRDQLVADVPSGLSLTTSHEKLKN